MQPRDGDDGEMDAGEVHQGGHGGLHSLRLLHPAAVHEQGHATTEAYRLADATADIGGVALRHRRDIEDDRGTLAEPVALLECVGELLGHGDHRIRAPDVLALHTRPGCDPARRAAGIPGQADHPLVRVVDPRDDRPCARARATARAATGIISTSWAWMRSGCSASITGP